MKVRQYRCYWGDSLFFIKRENKISKFMKFFLRQAKKEDETVFLINERIKDLCQKMVDQRMDGYCIEGISYEERKKEKEKLEIILNGYENFKEKINRFVFSLSLNQKTTTIKIVLEKIDVEFAKFLCSVEDYPNKAGMATVIDLLTDGVVSHLNSKLEVQGSFKITEDHIEFVRKYDTIKIKLYFTNKVKDKVLSRGHSLYFENEYAN